MATRDHTIGELARRAGVSVKTIRYYSNEGLLPPRGRTESGYRVYGDDAIVRLELIRTLREAGMPIAQIRAVTGRELGLADALRLQLEAVEAHLKALKQVASALRAALRSEPTEHDVRRLTAVTKLSNDERRALIARFYEDVCEGLPVDDAWKQHMIDASAPQLPDEPSPEQLDAWIALSEIIADPAFLAEMREGAQWAWTQDFDPVAYRAAADAMVAEARRAIEAGTPADAEAAAAIVERAVGGFGAAMGRPVDAILRGEVRRRFVEQDPRASRYWDLVKVLKGTPRDASEAAKAWPEAEYRWCVEAMRHHLR